ncbi:hypothetical protein KP509_1Z007800 [Ceratopteris richardii]|nr:hypothetical protein KP509_1Z007800 [Ceratopteris richardii]
MASQLEIQESFDKEHKDFPKMRHDIIMLKLCKLRQFQNQILAYLFEDNRKFKLNIQAQILLDIEKGINEDTLQKELKDISILISIAVKTCRDYIENKSNKTLEEIVSWQIK